MEHDTLRPARESPFSDDELTKSEMTAVASDLDTTYDELMDDAFWVKQNIEKLHDALDELEMSVDSDDDPESECVA